MATDNHQERLSYDEENAVTEMRKVIEEWESIRSLFKDSDNNLDKIINKRLNAAHFIMKRAGLE